MLNLDSRQITRRSGRTEWVSVVSVNDAVVCARYGDTQDESEAAALAQAQRLTCRDGIPAEAFSAEVAR